MSILIDVHRPVDRLDGDGDGGRRRCGLARIRHLLFGPIGLRERADRDDETRRGDAGDEHLSGRGRVVATRASDPDVGLVIDAGG